MKKLILVVLLITPTILIGQTLWQTDFNADANGATSGVITAGTAGGTWSVTTTPTGGAGSFSKQTLLGTEYFQVNNTTNEGVWSTNTVNIASVGYAIISSDIITGGFGFTNSDYVRFYYVLDGGAETLFAEVLGTLFSATTNVSAIVAGSTLKIVVRAQDNSFFGIVGFDNPTIIAAPVIYSRKSGTWTDVTGGVGGTGTWSLISHVGSACGCVPLNTQVAVVGNSHTVTLPVSQTATDPGPNNAPGAIDVENTGVLQFNTNGVTLGVQKGLVRVRSGGTINSSSAAITGEQISFNADVGGARLQVDAGGTASFQDLVLTSNASNTHFLEGGGSLTMTGDILINASSATLTNNLTTTVNAANILFGQTGNTIGSTFVNNGTVTLSGNLGANDATDDGNVFTNSSTGLLNVVSINTNSADFTVNNSGTINQSSNFTNAVAGDSFYNLNGSTWNFGGTHLGSALKLYCNNGTNTFNYNRGANANMITPQDAYSNLIISNAGTKVMLGSFSVNGNLSIQGTASLNPATFSLTVNGTTSITGGSFNDADATNAGTNTFVGNVSIASGTSFISTTVTTTGNLVFRGGIANGGTFTAGGATFNTNNQAITGTGAMSFANNVDISGITVTNSNSGAFTITGTTTLTNGGYTDSNNASVATFVGLVSQSGTSAFNTTAVSTEANLIFRGGITNNGGTFTGGGSTFNTNNQSIAGTSAISFANFVVVTGVTVSNNNTSSVSITPNGLSLSGTGTWTQGTNSTLNFAGSSISITTFNASNAGNTVNYNSALSTGNAQTIRVPNSGSYTNLTLNNTFTTSPQLTAAGNISVSGILTMTSGIVNLNGNTLTLSSSAAGALVHSLASTSGWMYGGSFKRTFANTTAITVGTVNGFFPLGSSADWRPFFVGVNSSANTAGTISVSHTDATTTSVVSIADTSPAATIVRMHDALWTPTVTGITAGTWNLRAGGTTFGTIAAGAADIRMSTNTGVVGTNAAGSGGPTDWRVNRTGLTIAQVGANSFHVSSTNAGTSPLPIKLLYFSATLLENQVNTEWATAQEINNDFFTVEKSSNPEYGFQTVLRVAGKGDSNVKQEYSSVDKFPYSGLSYYRLKQTDFDGKFTYSKLVSVYYEGSSLASLNVYPNPLKNEQSIKVELTGIKGVNEVPIAIYNTLGQKILERTLSVNTAGMASGEFVFEKPLASGVFVIKAGPTMQLMQRLVVE